MAVAPMKIVNIIGVESSFERVVELIGRSHMFQPEDAMPFYTEAGKFVPMVVDNKYQPMLSALDSCAPECFKLKEVEKELPFDELKSKTDTFIKKMTELKLKYSQTEQKLNDALAMSDELSHFVGLELNIKEIISCKYTSFRFGRLPLASYEKLINYKNKESILSFKCTSDDTYWWGVFFSPKEMSKELDSILTNLYFERIIVPESDTTIENRLDVIKQEIEQYRLELKNADTEVKKFMDEQKTEMSVIYSQIVEKNNYYEIKKNAAKYGDEFRLFVLIGWVPASDIDNFVSVIKDVPNIEINIDNAVIELQHNPPVVLKNKRLFKPFEMFVDMYGMPSYGEVDPTPFVAMTYTVLFGIMFGDLGQGLLLSLVGWLMWKVKQMELGKILIRCGFSSAVFGCIFGSVFGFENALDPLYRLLGFNGKPVDVMDSGTTNIIIYAAVGIGIFLVMCAMLINIYSCVRRRRFEDAFFGPNGVAGLIFYASLIFGLVGQLFLGMSILTPIYVIGLIILPLLVMFFKEPLGMLITGHKEKISWGEYIMQNFFELFEVILSYATNTMSFLRVGAFVLVHAGMMMVVFTLAEMTSGIGYVVVLIIGNIFVLGLEGLLVGIQVLRLEFYEMFSRFFDGSGRPFVPVSINNTNKN